MGFLSYYYYDIWNQYGDPIVVGYPLMDGGPWTTIFLVALYVYISKYAGPRWMQARPPYDPKKTILVYNVCLIFLNLYMFVHGMILTNFGLESWSCKRPDRFEASNPFRIFLGWLYFISKFIDFCDTFFFVLRKKERQLSFLHLYHHSIMPIGSWMFLKFVPYGNSAFVPLINSFVHIGKWCDWCVPTGLALLILSREQLFNSIRLLLQSCTATMHSPRFRV